MRWMQNNNGASTLRIQQQSGVGTPLRYQSRGVDAAGVYLEYKTQTLGSYNH